MRKAIKRAESGKDKKKRRHKSESEDRDELIEKMEAEAKIKEMKKIKKREGKK
jgi:hypothetical protein